MTVKLSDRGPEAALWAGAVLAQLHAGRVRTTAEMTAKADELVTAFRARLETEEEYQERRRAEREKPPATPPHPPGRPVK